MTRLLKENIPVVSYERLKFDKVPVIKSYLQKQLQSYPDYSGLASVSDVLKEYEVENIALRAGYNSA